ncbi:MAG: ArsA family ATPase [Anaerolineae bacterium]
MRTILFTGKGGVGKTTLSAATALRSASLGHRTLIISTDIAHNLADVFNVPLGNEPRQVGPAGLFAAELDSGAELEAYWGDIKRRIFSSLLNEGVSPTAAGELAVLPGLDEVLALVRVKRYYDEGKFDALVIDSAPTGAAMRLLSAPDLTRWYARHLLDLSRGISRVLMPVVRSVVKGPVGDAVVQERLKVLFDEITALQRLLSNGALTSVRLVLNPERMAVRETQRAYTYMNLFGLSVDALFVNRILPEAVDDPFFDQWKLDQAERRSEVRDLFDPLPVFEVPLMSREVMGVAELERLATLIYGDLDPVQRLSTDQPLRFETDGKRYVLMLRVTGVAGETVALEKRGDELLVKLGHFRRTLALPQYLVGLEPSFAQIEGDYLRITFEEP